MKQSAGVIFSCEGCGHAYISKTKHGFMVHAMLSPGEANSGKLVTLVRQNAKVLTEKENYNLIIIDGPLGIGCININNTEKMERFCKENNIEVIGKIPFNPIITEAMVNGKPIMEYSPRSDVAKKSRIFGKSFLH